MGSITKLNKDSNCSCSSCLFKSESDRQSIKNFLALGSKIDRLYYGKYIPLREQKLLKRLARTKAVYDDLRAPILSDSTLSIKRKRKLSPRNRLPGRKSSTLLQLANIRDQNVAFSSKNLIECCSCCSCSSKFNIDELQPKRYKRKQSHKSVNRTDRYKAQRGEYVGKKGVRFKTKHIRSDPCTCTFKLSGLLKNYSKTKFKKNRTSAPLPFDLESMAEENIKPKRSVSMTLYQNLKHQKELVTDAFSEGVKKFSDSRTKIPNYFDIYVKKSVEKLKQTAEKTISRIKPNNLKDIKLCECPEKDLVSQIKKDSLIKFKDDLRKKHIMKELECKPECDEHTCNPKECRVKLGQQESHKRKGQLLRNIDIKNGIDKRTKKVRKLKKSRNQELEEAVSSGNSITIKTKTKKQRQADKKLKRNIQNIESIKERNSRQAVRVGSSFSFNIEFYKNINEPSDKKDEANSRESHSSKQSLPTKQRSYKIKKTKGHNRSSQRAVNTKKAKKKRTILKRCFCTLSFRSNKSSTFNNKVIDDCKLKNVCNVPECKTQRLKHTQTEAFNEFHFSDRLLEPKHRNKIYRKVKRPKRNQQFLPKICDPGICIPDQCDPYNWIKIMNMRHTKIKKRSVKCLCSDKTKSTSSLTTRLAPTTTNYVQSVITYTKRPKYLKKQVEYPKYIKQCVEKTKPHQKLIIDDTRRAVRIGSTFSFNIEFYKNKNPLSDLSTTRQSLSVKPKHKTKAQKRQKMQYRMMAKNQENSSDHHIIRNVKNRKYYRKNGLKVDLKKCFCTLKLQENKLSKNKKLKMHSMATETAINSDFDILMLNRGTKMEQKTLRLLEPFECEPFVCIPGDCDPYLCLERIKNRHKQQKDASSITKPRLRDEGSTTSNSEISSKFIQVKPKLESKHEKTFPKAKLENFKRLKFDDSFSEDLKKNQSVNIGSSFSFNIEFKKSRLPTTLPTLQYSPKRKHFKNKTINNEILNFATHKTQMDKPSSNHKSSMIRPLIKRCFCTLNLQKKHKQYLLKNVFPNAVRNNIYTVNRILTKKTCHNYRYNTKNVDETHTNFVFKNDHFMSVNDLHPYPTKESVCISEKMYNKGTIRSLRMFQSTVHILESVKISSKLISSKKSLSFYKNLAINSRKSFVTHIPSQDHDMHHCNNSKDAEEISILQHLPMQLQQNYMSQYYKKCFCTMNLQIENLHNAKYRKRNHLESSAVKKYPRNFIHPQECDPGICIPGQCDPNECIKLIMKRNKNHKSIENNTAKIFTQSGSSNTYPFANKSTKIRQKLLLRKNLSENPKEVSDRKNDGVVRIGSSFSFDIEFYKNSKSLANKNNIYQHGLSPYPYKKIEKNKNKSSKPLKNLGTRMNEQNYHNMQSQSELTSGAHKGSATLPILNRCFCTLKLQKKGKMYKKLGSKDLKPMLFHDQNALKIKTASKSQNTKKIKVLKAPYQLKSFECKPNICDPGNCDPYQCLDIMIRNKRIKSFGVDPVILNKNKSIYSLTTKNKSKGSQGVRPYHDTPNTQQKLRLGNVKSSSIIPSKQAVRIGSNFSFNIEFFKDSFPASLDNGSLNGNRHVKYISQFTKTKPQSSAKPTSLQENPPKGLKIKYIKRKKSQVQNIIKKSSSMTSTFVKRCFCTAKLQRNNDKNIGSHFKKHPNPSFFTKCLCWIKKSQAPRSKLKNKGIRSVIKRCFCTKQFYNKNAKNYNIKTRTKSLMTENDKLTTETLLPYECEPGICIPYQCDPYKCDKIIQTRRKGKQIYEVEKRSKPILLPYECEPLTCIPGECNPIECLNRIKKREYQTKTLGTVAHNFKYTASTVTKSNIKSKNKINQAQIRNIFAKPNAKEEKTTKEVLASSLPNRQAVRIGSKFSFDIQFYKNTNIPDLKSYVTEKSIPQIKETPKKILKIQTPQQTSLVPVIPQIPAKHVKNKINNVDTKSFYKKCFCILKLNKFRTKPNFKTKNVKTSYSNTDDTNFKLCKQSELLPYECEPGVCIPGICDPFECKERIDKRNLKEVNQQTGNISRSKQRGTKSMRKKSVKSQISKSVKYKEEQNINRLQNNNINKNVCRIGSEFSFEIEFFKNRFANPDRHNIKIVDQEKHINKSNRTSNTKLMHNYALQTNMQNKNLKSLSIQSPLKRCFCTLRFQKLPDNSLKYRYHKNNLKKIKPSQRSVMSNVTSANLNIPLLNSPDKYGKAQRKSRSATSQVVRQCFDKAIGMKALKHKKNVQTNIIDKFSKKDNLKSNGREKRSVKAHIFQKPYNKQALKIGSNISFEIDFYKQRPPKMEFININHNPSISRQKKDSYSNVRYSSNRTSQMKRMPRSKALQVNKVLKRCFCTLKLQDMNSKPIIRNIPKLGGMQRYPQVLEVRRVSIQRQPKQIAQQTTSPISCRTVATQSKKKSKKKRVSKQSQCPFCFISENSNTNEMKTILPYTPKKFNRCNSKTLLAKHQIENYHHVNKKATINKRLTKQKSHKGINIVKSQKYDSDKKSAVLNIKKFFCQCVNLLSPKKNLSIENVTQDSYKISTRHANKSNKLLTIEDVLNLCENERCPVKKVKKNKERTIKSNKYKSWSQTHTGKHSRYGSNENYESLQLKTKKNEYPINTKSNKVLTMKNNKRKPDIHCTCDLFREQTKDNIKMNTLCSFCQNKLQEEINRNNLSSPRLNVRFLEPLVTSQTDFLDKKKKSKKHVKSSHSKSQIQKRCLSCGRIINTEEIRKGAGDYSDIRRKHRKRSESSIDKLKRIFRNSNCHKLCNNKDMHKPAFDMILNSGNYNIINKDDVVGNFASLSVTNEKNIYSSSRRKHKKPKPCVCGSLICAEKDQRSQNKKSLWKPCLCSSSICRRESAIMKGISADPNQITCLCQKMQEEGTKKLKINKQKHVSKQIKDRVKQQNKEDDIRRRKREKIDKEREKEINKNSSDLVLCAESMIDIGKLGITAGVSILRGVVRISSNPKQAIRNLKDMKQNPKLIKRNLKIALDDIGVASTIKRVRLRCLAMRGVKRLKRILESFPITNYILHIADKHPKKRIVKPKRQVRRRERVDYGCSLYMGSLRKRPFLSIYKRCPWFYAHFLSLINFYKQFRDIMLFLLAVVFWSPCILCTEICRAMTCCIFCTG